MAVVATLNLADFCARTGALEGGLDIESFPRLCSEVVDVEFLKWHADGRLVVRHELAEFAGRPMLHLVLEGAMRVACVRCLEPVRVVVSVDQFYVAVESEEQADAALLEDERFDAVVDSMAFDLAALIEDEVLMALPAQPRHERCPQPALAALGLSAGDEGVSRQMAKESPFAVLQGLKKR